jgi:hypothetical protein
VKDVVENAHRARHDGQSKGVVGENVCIRAALVDCNYPPEFTTEARFPERKESWEEEKKLAVLTKGVLFGRERCDRLGDRLRKSHLDPVTLAYASRISCAFLHLASSMIMA